MRRLNLSNYEVCSKEEATLEIIPKPADSGASLPSIFFKTIRAKKPTATVENITDGFEWNPKVYISIDGSPKEYCDLVYWWFENAVSNDEYRNIISKSYSRLNDINDTIEQAKAWLLTTAAYTQTARGKYLKRKKEIGKYLTSWLTRALDKQLYGRRG